MSTLKQLLSSTLLAPRSEDLVVADPSSPSVSWLHLSDIHFGHGREAYQSVDQDVVSRQLLCDAEEMANRVGPPDFIFMTGDIAFKGDSEHEYPNAVEWFQTLLSKVNSSADHVFVVPGNHDVDRTKVNGSPASRLIHQALRNDPKGLDALLLSPEDLSVVWRKLDSFSSFSEHYGNLPHSSSSPFWTMDVNTSLGPVVVVGLNTALLSFDDGDRPANLAIGLAQINEAVRKQPEDALLLVLQHHPPDWLSDGSELESALLARPHITFCGHIHRRGGSVRLPLHGLGDGFLQLAAGAGHSDPSELAEHSYSWGRLSGTGFSYYPRIWDDEKRCFLADGRFGEGVLPGGAATVPSSGLPRALQQWLSSRAPSRTEEEVLFGIVGQWSTEDLVLWRLRLDENYDSLDDSRVSVLTERLRHLSGDTRTVRVKVISGSVVLLFLSSEESYSRVKRLHDQGMLGPQLDSVVIELERVRGATVHAGFSQAAPEPAKPALVRRRRALLSPTTAFQPASVTGITFRPDKPTSLNFICDKGDFPLTADAWMGEVRKIITYFWEALAVPSEHHWVNLSVYESNRMLAKELRNTSLGRDMLSQDCVLKHFVSSLLHPTTETGRRYWGRVRESLGSGAFSLPGGFHKVWIEPQEARVWTNVNEDGSVNFDRIVTAGIGLELLERWGVDERDGWLFVSDQTLSVLCEIDPYAEAQERSAKDGRRPRGVGDVHLRAFREFILPVVEKEVTEGWYFANLRQFYNSMILAAKLKSVFTNFPEYKGHIDGNRPARSTRFDSSDLGHARGPRDRERLTNEVSRLRMTHGSNHTRTLETAQKLARVHQQLGEVHEARTVIQKVVDGWETTVGRRHPDTARAMVDLATALEATGDYGEAFHLHREAVAVFRELLGSGHPATVAATHNLVHAAKTKRNKETASEIESQVTAFSQVDWNSFYYQKYLELFNDGVFDEEVDEFDVRRGQFVRKRYVSGALCLTATARRTMR